MTKTVETIPGTRAFGHRLANCEINFANRVAAIIGGTQEDGFKVLAAYRKMKVVKIDTANQTYNVKHGAFLDASVLRRAINS